MMNNPTPVSPSWKSFPPCSPTVLSPQIRTRSNLWRGGIILMLTAVVGTLVSSCTPTNQSENLLRYGLTLAPSGIDPHLHASVELGIPLSSVYDTLVFQDPASGEFLPGLARDWQTSEDFTTYTFLLREDVHFHDGTDFNAQAVKANFDYVLDPENNSLRAKSMLGPVSSVEVIDTYTVSLHLDTPYAPLLDSLSQVYLGMASPAALERWGPSDYQFHQVGTGPYQFVEYIPNDHLLLQRNPDYRWSPDIYDEKQATIERVEFLFYEDKATRASALERGEIHIIGEVPPQSAARLESLDVFNLYPVPIPGQPLQFFLNTQRPPTDDVAVREALILGTDRESIVRTVFGPHSRTADGILSMGTQGYAPQAAFPNYNPDRASQLLADAGWVDVDGDDTLELEGKPLRINLVSPNWGSNPEVAQLVQSGWQALGIEVDLVVAPGFGALNDLQAQGEYHAIGFNTFGTDPDLLQPFYHSLGFFNWSGVNDPTLDRLLIQGAQTVGRDSDRREIYRQIARFILDHWLVLPIRDYTNLVVANSRVQDLQFSAQGWFPFLIDLKLLP